MTSRAGEDLALRLVGVWLGLFSVGLGCAGVWVVWSQSIPLVPALFCLWFALGFLALGLVTTWDAVVN